MVRFIKPKKKTEPPQPESEKKVSPDKGIISMATERDKIAKPIIPSTPVVPDYPAVDNKLKNEPNIISPPPVVPIAETKSKKEEELEHKLSDLEHKLHDVEEKLHKEQEKLHEEIIHSNEHKVVDRPKEISPKEKISFSDVKITRDPSKLNILQQVGVVFFVLFLVICVVFIRVNWPQPTYTSSIVLQASTADKTSDLMLTMMGIDGIRQYLFRPALLKSFVETSEKFDEKKYPHKVQLENYLNYYRHRLNLNLDESQKKIILSVSSNEPQKTAVLTKLLVQAYIKMRLIFTHLDETQTLFKKTVQDLLKARDDDWAFEVSDDEKNALDLMSSQHKVDMQTVLTQLQTQIIKIKERLDENSGVIKKQLLLKNDSREMYIFNALKFRLIKLEFSKLAESRTYSSIVGESTQDKIIAGVKSSMVDLMKKSGGSKMSLAKEELLALYMKKVFLELKIKAILMVQNNSYGPKESFTSSQREFAFKINKVNEIVDKYQSYLGETQKIISEANQAKLTPKGPAPEKNFWVKAFTKEKKRIYIQWAGIGLLIGLIFNVVNNLVFQKFVKQGNVNS